MRLSRRSFLFVLLALLMLLVQQGALRHELSHELASPSTELRDDDGIPAPVCEACLAYAVVGAALPSSAHILPLAFDPPLPPLRPAVALAGLAPHAYRARAPPLSRPG